MTSMPDHLLDGLMTSILRREPNYLQKPLQILINERTHIQKNSSYCIDLIFTDQSNMSVNYGAHSSLHPNCHQIVRLIWDYKNITYMQY